MKSFKILTVLVVGFFVAVISGFVFMIVFSQHSKEYLWDTNMRVAKVFEGDALFAEYEGETVSITEEKNIEMINQLLTSKLWRKLSRPRFDHPDDIVFVFEDGARYTVFADEEAEDCVYILYEHERTRRTLYFDVDEHDNIVEDNSFEWVKQIITSQIQKIADQQE